MKRGMRQYRAEKCAGCGKPISTHNEPEYQRCLHPEVFVSIADRIAAGEARFAAFGPSPREAAEARRAARAAAKAEKLKADAGLKARPWAEAEVEVLAYLAEMAAARAAYRAEQLKADGKQGGVGGV